MKSLDNLATTINIVFIITIIIITIITIFIIMMIIILRFRMSTKCNHNDHHHHHQLSHIRLSTYYKPLDPFSCDQILLSENIGGAMVRVSLIMMMMILMMMMTTIMMIMWVEAIIKPCSSLLFFPTAFSP